MMDWPRLLSNCENPQWDSEALHLSAASSKNDFMRQVERYSEESWGGCPSLVKQWLVIRLPVPGIRVRSLLREDLTFCRAN